MTTDQVEGTLKAIEDALYDVVQENDYITRLNDFDSVFELDTKDGHRITIEVRHTKLTPKQIAVYEGESKTED